MHQRFPVEMCSVLIKDFILVVLCFMTKHLIRKSAKTIASCFPTNLRVIQYTPKTLCNSHLYYYALKVKFNHTK